MTEPTERQGSQAARVRLEKFRRDFIGLHQEGPVVATTGEAAGRRRRVYLDSGATTLMPRMLQDALGTYCAQALANSHSNAHHAARVTSREIARSRSVIETFFGADPASHVVLFAGNGATGALNRLADALFPPEVRLLLRGGRSKNPELRAIFGDLREWASERGVDAANVLHRNLVVVSRIEHHSNLLPWMRAVGSRNLRFPALTPDGELDLDDLARILRADGDRVRLVAISGASNVTGVVTPVREVARLAHSVGAEIVVDAAQWAPHMRVRMHDPADLAGDIDHLAVSGHKLYAPGSRGVLVTRRHTFTGPEAVGDVGGGMAEVVSVAGYAASLDVTQREEGGTPNLPGSLALGLVLEAISSFGMELVEEHERALVESGFERLRRVPGAVLYGPPDPTRAPRVAVFSFNVGALPHGLVAAALSDTCNIAVRNGSFCAQLYVRHLLGDDDGGALQDTHSGGCATLPGLVRASCGIYTTDDDLAALEDGLRYVVANADALASNYDVSPSGEFVRRDRPAGATFEISAEVGRYFLE